MASKRNLGQDEDGGSSRQKVQARGPPKLDPFAEDCYTNPAPGDPLPPVHAGQPVPFKTESAADGRSSPGANVDGHEGPAIIFDTEWVTFFEL